MTFEETIEDYLENYRPKVKNSSKTVKFSASSQKNRRYELNRFARFCAKHKIKDPEKLNKNIAKAYVKSLKVSDLTKNTAINILVSFMDYLVTKDLILDNYAAYIGLLKAEYPESDILHRSEVEKVFRLEAETASTKFVDRNLLIFNLMFQVCLRANEVSNLKMQDLRRLDDEYPEIQVTRKGGKRVFMPINDDLVRFFKAWMDIRDGFKNAQRTDWVFLSSQGTQVTTNRIYLMVQKAIRRAGLIRNKLGPHILRHSGATVLSELGATPQEIQFYMNHASIQSTQKYLHHHREGLRRSVNRMSWDNLNENNIRP